MPGLTPEELLTTTRSVRKRLDLERPVSREVVEECLRIAFQAPNGSNTQTWGWVLVDDPALKVKMAEIYRQGLVDHQASPYARPAGAPRSPAAERISSSVQHLMDHMHEVPVLLVPTIGGRLEGAGTFGQASIWGSILPGVWNFMLALRTRGMGSAWTTLHLHREEEMADLLGIPYQKVTQAGMFPIAYTLGDKFHPADRSNSEQSIHWNGW